MRLFVFDKIKTNDITEGQTGWGGQRKKHTSPNSSRAKSMRIYLCVIYRVYLFHLCNEKQFYFISDNFFEIFRFILLEHFRKRTRRTLLKISYAYSGHVYNRMQARDGELPGLRLSDVCRAGDLDRTSRA